MAAKEDLLRILEDVVEKALKENRGTIGKLREYGDKLNYLASKDIVKGDVNVLLIAIASSSHMIGKGEEEDRETIKSLAVQMVLLWFAGYATSAATTACCAFEMGWDDSIWDRLMAEQDDIVADAGFGDVTYDQVNGSMPLLESYITEIVRLYPAASGINRRADKDVVVLGRLVRAGESLMLEFPGAMRDERIYETPDTVIIDRFLKEKNVSPPPKIACFGSPGSVHYCLGAALAKVFMKTTLAVLLRKYRFRLDPKQSRAYTTAPEFTPKSKVVVNYFGKRKAET